MMIRFLDLTLLLLMSLLLQTDLAVEHAVGLPHGDGSGSNHNAQDALLLRVEPASWLLTEAGEEICGGQSNAEAVDCLRGRSTPTTTILVAPGAGVHVQRLVDMLDVCARATAQCSVGGAPP